jgi:hypothetical protein
MASNYSENEMKELAAEQSFRIRRQRHKALILATEYIMGTSHQNICDFINLGKLDINKGHLWQKEV